MLSNHGRFYRRYICLQVFSEVMEDLHNHINPDTNRHAPLISTELYNLIMEHKDLLNSVLIYDRWLWLVFEGRLVIQLYLFWFCISLSTMILILGINHNKNIYYHYLLDSPTILQRFQLQLLRYQNPWKDLSSEDQWESCWAAPTYVNEGLSGYVIFLWQKWIQ